jgi:transcriptional regulator with XRE-family HTH domain
MALPRLHRDIDPSAVRAFRERRGWTLEQMADEVWASPMEVAAWEGGTVRVPPAQARRIRAIAAVDRRRPVELTPGPGRLPRCAWADANAPGLHDVLFRDPAEVESNLAVQEHLATCAECQRVERFGQFARTLPAVPDGPEDLGADLDSWRSVLLYAMVPVVILAAGVGLTKLGELPGVPDPANVWVEAIVFFWVGERTGRYAGRHLQGRPYATGLLSGIVGMLAAMLTWRLRAPDPDLADPVVLAVCAVVALGFGLLGGWMRDVRDDDAGPADAETPPHPAMKEREA